MRWFHLGLCCFILFAPHRARAAEISDAQFAFVSSFEGHTLWVSHTPWKAQPLRSRPTWLSDDAAFAKMAEKSLPVSLRALAGQSVSLFDADGKELCQASLQSWGVLAEYDQGNDNWADLSPQTLIKRMFAKSSDARRRYAAELAVPETCANARWARATSLPPAAVFKVSALAGKALLAERAGFRGTPQWAETQKRFTKKGRFDEDPDTQVQAYSCQVRGERFLFATLFQFSDCESFDADIVLTFRGRGKRAVQLPNDLSSELEPKLALDLNLDGTPEWMTLDMLIGWDGERFSTVIDNSSLFSSCPC